MQTPYLPAALGAPWADSRILEVNCATPVARHGTTLASPCMACVKWIALRWRVLHTHHVPYTPAALTTAVKRAAWRRLPSLLDFPFPRTINCQKQTYGGELERDHGTNRRWHAHAGICCPQSQHRRTHTNCSLLSLQSLRPRLIGLGHAALIDRNVSVPKLPG